MFWPFFIGLIVYIAAVFLSYSEKIKVLNAYFVVGLILGIIANFCWLYIAKNSPEKHQIYVYGLYWDSMIVGVYTLIPILAMGVRLSWTTAIGGLLIIAGIMLTKLSA